MYQTLRVTPAMKTRMADHVWSMEAIVSLAHWYGRPDRVWSTFRHRNVGVLCPRRSQRVVHSRVCFRVRTRVGLWFSARGMALRSGRSHLGARRTSPMACQEETFKLTHWWQGSFLSLFRASIKRT